MLNLWRTVACLTILLTSTEAATSQIQNVDSGVSLESFTQYSPHIVVVKPSSGKWETYKEIHVGTRKERDRAPEEIYYKEQVENLEVVEVLKSETIKPGDVIKAWHKPGYTLEDMKSIAEGMNLYTATMRYQSKFPPKGGEERIVFMSDKQDDKNIYSFNGEESISAKSDVQKALAEKNVSITTPLKPIP